MTRTYSYNNSFVTKENNDEEDEEVLFRQVKKRAENFKLKKKLKTKDSVKETVKNSGVAYRQYSVLQLRDLADVTIAHAFIDNLAHDVAATDFKILKRDNTDEEVDKEKRQEIRKSLMNLHAEHSLNEVLEMTVRSILKVGDSAWVLKPDDEEIVIPDIATMRKKINDVGQVEKYVQGNWYNDSNVGTKNKFDKDEVAWFSWSVRNDKIYGESPVIKSIKNIKIINEIMKKEIMDLEEGSMSGILTLEDSEGMNKKEFKDLKKQLVRTKGKRHVFATTRGKWNWVNLTSNYEELKLLERFKFHLTQIASVFKVNPSYAGFEFENVNRATDESQSQNYKERGFETVLKLIEQKINKDVMPMIDDDYKIEFEVEKTVEDLKDKVKYYKIVGDVVEHFTKLGADVSFEDDNLIIEDKKFELDEFELNSEDEEKDKKEQLLNSLDISEDEKEELKNKINY